MDILLDENTQKLVSNYLPTNFVLSNLANFFSVFSDATRVKIISALTISEMCVTDISELLKLNQTTVSHQLKILRGSGVVESRRDGKIIYYEVKSDLVSEVLLNGVSYLGF
jgi:DNA-binding transcriptional ArsR family regulator